MKILFIIVMALFASPHTVAQQTRESEIYFPQQMTAKQLLLACASSTLTTTGRERLRYCYGFVSGVEEGIRLHGLQYSTDVVTSLCVPRGISSRQMANAYVKYTSGKNVDLDRPAALVVVDALKNAYPC
jgi:hypothetical protein